jgi:hypothetical protein
MADQKTTDEQAAKNLKVGWCVWFGCSVAATLRKPKDWRL